MQTPHGRRRPHPKGGGGAARRGGAGRGCGGRAQSRTPRREGGPPSRRPSAGLLPPCTNLPPPFRCLFSVLIRRLPPAFRCLFLSQITAFHRPVALLFYVLLSDRHLPPPSHSLPAVTSPQAGRAARKAEASGAAAATASSPTERRIAGGAGRIRFEGERVRGTCPASFFARLPSPAVPFRTLSTLSCIPNAFLVHPMQNTFCIPFFDDLTNSLMTCRC